MATPVQHFGRDFACISSVSCKTADGKKKVVLDYMGRFRIFLAEQMGIIDQNKMEFLWVLDFPMFE